MPPTIPELIAALPADSEAERPIGLESLPRADLEESLLPVPVGRFRRFSALGTLQAKITAAYLFYWLRSWFQHAEDRQRLLAETHWRTAMRLLDSMGYLRGLVMKVGQTLANFPDIAPREFVDTLEKLHFDAPPMHWSLLREMVLAELGEDPEHLFAEFEKRAFAAASLGQVHRARLRSGEKVAVKVQYPGIARAIRADFRNLNVLLLSARLTKDWESTRDQFEDLAWRLEQETDYVLEAQNLQKARSLFREEDGIVVPRVYTELSSTRVLTMERLEGVHLGEFLAKNPSQEERNDVARKILRAWYRLMYSGRMLYVDVHPGNFLVLPDGRLGLLDFGLIIPLHDEEWDLYRRLDRAMTTGHVDDRLEAIRIWNGEIEEGSDHLRLLDEYSQWTWMCRSRGGEFDFGDEADFRRGIDLFAEMIRKRYTRTRPNTPSIARSSFASRAVLYQLKAQVDIRAIAEDEIVATGWDRSAYTGA